MGTLLPENLCVHRKGEIEKLIKDRARDAAAQPQILFGKPTGDHDGPEELLVELFTSFTGSLFSHALIRSCEDCEVIQIPNRVRSPIGDKRSVDPGESSKRPAAKDLKGCCKRRCTQKHDQVCQATEQVQYPLNNPQNPLLEAHHFSFTSETISSQDSEPNSQSLGFPSQTFSDSEPHSLGFSSKRISTQYTSPCPSSASSVRKECGVETVQSNSLSGDLPFLPSRRPQPMIAFSQGLDWIGRSLFFHASDLRKDV